ncbi:hypothetical protein DW094_13045 [Ruminococcaceae bacterium AM07-15]|nr:hypothetical protein DW094_13045 [Ruminococcaceae bacterium AM07-15]
MTRITTNGMLFNYRYNLMTTTNQLNKAMTQVMTRRSFNAYAENPAGATRAFKIHSSLNATRAQYDNNKTVTSKFETAWSIMDGVINDLAHELGKVPAMEGLNGTNLDNLDTQAQILRSGAESIIQSLNGRYDQDFIFAGSDNQEAPFAIEDGHVTYRGVKVDAELEDTYHDKNDNPIIKDGKEMTNGQVLQMWAEEDPLYVDIGLGFELEDGKVVESTAFDASISGIKVMGYGVDEDGDPKNLASIMLRMAEVFESYDPENKGDPWNGNEEEANRLINKFNDAHERMSDAHSELMAKANFLEANGTTLENTFDSLNTERQSLENVEPADAVMALSWAQLCYSAALQVGVNVIPQSLMDYMK